MTVEEALRRAEVLTDLGRFDDADPFLAQALAEQPDSEDGLALRMRGLVNRRQFAEAATVTELLLRAHPTSIRGLLAMARIQWLLGRPRDGVPFARRAVELSPDSPRCLLTLADLLKRIQPGSSEALALIDEVIALDAESADAYLLAGEIHLHLARYAEAERWILRALAITPDRPGAILKLGLARAGLGRFDESREAVVATLRMDAQASNLRSVVEYVELAGVPDHFAEIYRMALTALGRPDLSHPGAAGDDPELLAAQGKLINRMCSLHATSQSHERAAAIAEALLAVDAANQDARYVVSRAHNDSGRYTEALAMAEQLIEEGYADAEHSLAIAQIELNLYAEALTTLQRGLRREPDSPKHLVMMVICLRGLDRHDEALRVARHAAKVSSHGIGIQLHLGLAAQAAGELELAEQAFRTAIAQSAKDHEAVAALALLYAQNDRWPEAQELIAQLRSERAAGVSLGRPGIQLATACIGRAVGPLSAVDDDADEAEVRTLLDHAAPWLDVALDLYAITAAGMRRDQVADIPRMLGDLLAALHRMPAWPDTEYARVLRRYDAMIDTWRLA